jgi:hypothetical protein
MADGPIPQKDVKQHSDSAGHSWATIKRAKKSLGVRAERRAETGDGLAAAGRWYWSLPDVSAAPKVLKSSYEAHVPDVSTLGKFEPLRNQERLVGTPATEPRQTPETAHRPPNAEPASADEDRTCAQCQGPVDGKERQVAIGDAGTVWLHSECRRFYLPSYPVLPDSLNRNLRNGAPGHVKGTGSLIHGDFQ